MMTISSTILKTRQKTTTEQCQLLTSNTSLQQTFMCSQSAPHPFTLRQEQQIHFTVSLNLGLYELQTPIPSVHLGTKGTNFRQMSIKPSTWRKNWLEGPVFSETE